MTESYISSPWIWADTPFHIQGDDLISHSSQAVKQTRLYDFTALSAVDELFLPTAQS